MLSDTHFFKSFQPHPTVTLQVLLSSSSHFFFVSAGSGALSEAGVDSSGSVGASPAGDSAVGAFSVSGGGAGSSTAGFEPAHATHTRSATGYPIRFAMPKFTSFWNYGNRADERDKLTHAPREWWRLGSPRRPRQPRRCRLGPRARVPHAWSRSSHRRGCRRNALPAVTGHSNRLHRSPRRVIMTH